jgi:hypothetical protein
MHTEKREDPLVEIGYEVRDLNTVAIRNATIGFFVFAIGSALIGFACYRVMNPTVFEPSTTSNRVVPAAPYPLIQSNMAAKIDIMDIRQHETKELTAPIGWTDSSKTHLHVPIERAMDIIAKNGLKPTGASVPAVSKGHTPNPEIGEKPAANAPQAPASVPATVTGGSIQTKATFPVTSAPKPPALKKN